MSEKLILFGAGSAGRETLAHLRKQGIEPVCFADNDPAKQCTLSEHKTIEGLCVFHPKEAITLFPDSTWIVTIYKAEAREVREQLKQMGVKTAPLGTHLKFCQPINSEVLEHLYWGFGDDRTSCLLDDQVNFRRYLNYESQLRPDPISELYFPPFIRKIENEVFVDCGAADGDSIAAFEAWQPKYKAVLGFEPDHFNFDKLFSKNPYPSDLNRQHYYFNQAVGDHCGMIPFVCEGTTASHVGESDCSVAVETLDEFLSRNTTISTFIKMDIEGAELEALWGARKILKEHKPVLAICAYHEPDHLWEIPLLIHAIQPDYELRLRRYAEGTRELVWYAVPKDRIQDEKVSYSDDLNP